MTNLPEAKLAREAEICYSTIAFSTDYDCWHDTAEDVSVSEILRILAQSTKTAKSAIRHAIKQLPDKRDCVCATALKYAMVTGKKHIPEKTKKDLEPIIGKYLKSA
jgi:5'-methylthioadenosine phosphorylase